jgi:hypothetical protein
MTHRRTAGSPAATRSGATGGRLDGSAARRPGAVRPPTPPTAMRAGGATGRDQ